MEALAPVGAEIAAEEGIPRVDDGAWGVIEAIRTTPLAAPLLTTTRRVRPRDAILSAGRIDPVDSFVHPADCVAICCLAARRTPRSAVRCTRARRRAAI